MTVCNMSIEAGARAGLVAVDETTIDYLRGRPGVPAGDEFEDAAERWRTFVSDDDAEFDATVVIDAKDLVPFITWGTNPAQVVALRWGRALARGRSAYPMSAKPSPEPWSTWTSRPAPRCAT